MKFPEKFELFPIFVHKIFTWSLKFYKSMEMDNGNCIVEMHNGNCIVEMHNGNCGMEMHNENSKVKIAKWKCIMEIA